MQTLHTTRSAAQRVRATLPADLPNDKSLTASTEVLTLRDARPFGATVDKTHWLFIIVDSALADGRERGRLFGHVSCDEWVRNGAMPAVPHSTNKIVAFCAPNLIKTEDGTVYRVASIKDLSPDDIRFELTDIIGNWEWSALWP